MPAGSLQAAPIPVRRAAAAHTARFPTRGVGGLAVVAALAGTLFFFHLGTYGLWEPDEARYAEIAREMLALHSFLVPHLNYVPYIEKPPLLYWLTALSMQLLGVGQLSARLANAAAALLGVIAIYLFVLRSFDYRRAVLAAVILATSPLYAVMAQVLTTDMLLTATMTLAMCAFFLQWREGGRWWWLFYSAMGLAVLTKGPVGAVIPLMVGAIFLWYEGQLRSAIARFHVPLGFGLTALICLPWFVFMAIRQPGFVDFYFVGEYLRRFLQPHYSHTEPLYYYIPVLAGGFLPWTLMVPLIPWRTLAPDPGRRFCLMACATILVLFSLASAKLVPYILPAFPFMAVVTADGLIVSLEQRIDLRRFAAIGPPLALAAIAVLMVAFNAGRLASPYPLLVRPALYAAGAVVGVFSTVAFVVLWQRRLLAGLAMVAGGAALTLIVMSYGRIMAEPARSYAPLARRIEQLAPKARLICYPRYIQSLPFYARRRVVLVGARTELNYGAEHVPDAAKFFLAGPNAVLRLWQQPQPSVLVIDRGALAQIKRRLGPFKVIASDTRKLALIHPDSARK